MKPIVLSGLLLSMPLLALGQPAAAPSFEVASVKLHTFPRGTFGFGAGPGGEGVDIRISGNRVTIGQSTFTRLVMAAYNVKDFQIAGVPEILGRDQFYDVAAKVEGEDTPVLEQVRPMLRTLLADRFQLQFHRETKELSVYNLVVGKNGPKLKESTGPTPPQPVANNGPVIRFNLSVCKRITVALFSGRDGVIPIAMKRVWAQVNRRKLLFAHLDALRILARVQLTLDLEPSSGGC
jgi:uncharacterized protein (TIGR03435 family)